MSRLFTMSRNSFLSKAKSSIEDVDDRDYLSSLVKATCAALPDPKPKKSRHVSEK